MSLAMHGSAMKNATGATDVSRSQRDSSVPGLVRSGVGQTRGTIRICTDELRTSVAPCTM
jgi:hypothetical protein